MILAIIMGKEAITITIDSHIHQWIKEQGGNKSKVVNRLLANAWYKTQEEQPKIPGRKKNYGDPPTKEATFSLRPSEPSSNGVHYLVQIRESRLHHYLHNGFTLHDSRYALDEQATLVWNVNNVDVDLFGFPIGEEE